MKYEGVYPGVDLVYYGNQRQLEYDFVVAPGADPHRIQFDIRGARSVYRDENGDLVVQMPEREIRWRKPIVYQETGGKRREIDGRYVISYGRRVGFAVAAYDPKRPLTIDPVLVYSTYLGGGALDIGQAIAADSAGNAYVTGATQSTDFPTINALQPTLGSGGQGDVFVTKFNPTGSALIYSTYLGGSGLDEGYGIAADGSGNAYITGFANSTDFPVTSGAFQTVCGSCGVTGTANAFVSKLTPTGSALVYSTYLGGSVNDFGTGIAVDNSGDAYITGFTESANFPTMNPFQAAEGGIGDAFVTKFNPTGSALVYSTYLGGGDGEEGTGIAVDGSGDAYITGYTSSTNFPTMNPFQGAYGGGDFDTFVTVMNPSGEALVYSTYLGGNGTDWAQGIAVDSSGDAYITGFTESTNFPTMNPFKATLSGNFDAFVTRFNPTGSALVYSTYLGGSGNDFGQGIAVDSLGDAYITGQSRSTDFPTMNPLQSACNNGNNCEIYGDAFVTEMNPSGTALVYSTYLGGSGMDWGYGIAVDSSGNAYVTGSTQSTDFLTVNPIQHANAGSGDAFVAKIVPATVTLVPSSLNFGNQNVGTNSSAQNVTLTNSGSAALNISSIAATGDFAQTNTCPVGGNLAAGSACTTSVTFRPTAEGTRNGAITVTDNAVGSPQTVPLSGVGLQALVKLSPSSVNFGNMTVGGNGTQQGILVNLTNTGNATLHISSIAITGADSGDFIQSNLCPSSLAAGFNCTISVQFVPTTAGTRTGALTVTDNAANSPQSVSLTGVGVSPAVTLSPSSLLFPTQVVFTNSKTQTVTLNNTGLGSLFITDVAVSGPFTQTNNCGATVSPGSACTFTVTFKPTKAGAVTGALSITDNAPLSPQAVSLKGTGTYVQFNPASFNFGNQPVGTKSLPKKITLSNKGSVSVSISKISLTGINAADFAETNTCGTRVAAGASCFITVTFTPSAKGLRSASVTVTDNGGGSPQKVGVAGTGT